MRLSTKLAAGVLGGRTPAWKKLVNLFGRSSIVEIWPLDERTGTTAYGVVNGYNGTYTGVDLAATASRVPGCYAPYFDGVNDRVDLPYAAIDAAINRNDGSMFLLGKYEPSALTDNQQSFDMSFGTSGSAWVIALYKSTDNKQNHSINFNGTWRNSSFSSVAGWVNYGITWNKPQDKGQYFWDTTLKGEPAPLGTIVGNPFNHAKLGCGPSGTNKKNGWLSYAYILNRAATAAEIAAANRILGGA